MTKEQKKQLESLLCLREIEILKNQTEVEFILDKETLDLTNYLECLYGQIFKDSFGTEAMAFKKSYSLVFENDANSTQLENFLYDLWEVGDKSTCHAILEEFCTWKEDVSKPDICKLLGLE